MTVTTIPKAAERLIKYLEANGGKEVTTFENNLGQPDMEAARMFAEKLRAIHKKYIDLIKIDQQYNKVTISVT
jgi:argininosuccinate synthase